VKVAKVAKVAKAAPMSTKVALKTEKTLKR
jgi:hypothetical protein